MSDEWHQVQDADSPASYSYKGEKPPTLKFKEYVHHEGKVLVERANNPDGKRIYAQHAFTERYILAAGAEIWHASNAERSDLVSRGILPRKEPADGWEQAGKASKLACVGHAYFAIDSNYASMLKQMFSAAHIHRFHTKEEIHCYPDPEIPNALRTDIPIKVT